MASTAPDRSFPRCHSSQEQALHATFTLSQAIFHHNRLAPELIRIFPKVFPACTLIIFLIVSRRPRTAHISRVLLMIATAPIFCAPAISTSVHYPVIHKGVGTISKRVFANFQNTWHSKTSSGMAVQRLASMGLGQDSTREYQSTVATREPLIESGTNRL